MAELEITQAQLESLAAKLDTLDLDDDDRVVLHAVFAAAAPGDEVAGFAHSPRLADGFLNVFKPGGKVGFGGGDNLIQIIIVPIRP